MFTTDPDGLTIEQRLQRLEASARRWRIGCLAALAVACVGAGRTEWPGVAGKLISHGYFDTVHCKQLVVVSEDHLDGAVIYCAPDANGQRKGGCGLAIYGADGARTVIAGGNPTIGVFNADGTTTAIR